MILRIRPRLRRNWIGTRPEKTSSRIGSGSPGGLHSPFAYCTFCQPACSLRPLYPQNSALITTGVQSSLARTNDQHRRIFIVVPEGGVDTIRVSDLVQVPNRLKSNRSNSLVHAAVGWVGDEGTAPWRSHAAKVIQTQFRYMMGQNQAD
jgi:hypothetical protein